MKLLDRNKILRHKIYGLLNILACHVRRSKRANIAQFNNSGRPRKS